MKYKTIKFCVQFDFSMSLCNICMHESKFNHISSVEFSELYINRATIKYAICSCVVCTSCKQLVIFTSVKLVALLNNIFPELRFKNFTLRKRHYHVTFYGTLQDFLWLVWIYSSPSTCTPNFTLVKKMSA